MHADGWQTDCCDSRLVDLVVVLVVGVVVQRAARHAQHQRTQVDYSALLLLLSIVHRHLLLWLELLLLLLMRGVEELNWRLSLLFLLRRGWLLLWRQWRLSDYGQQVVVKAELGALGAETAGCVLVHAQLVEHADDDVLFDDRLTLLSRLLAGRRGRVGRVVGGRVRVLVVLVVVVITGCTLERLRLGAKCAATRR